ncbi:MAG: O-antigen ligase family protein [Brevundimonas sp.]|nr:O-antigen ligase family protein [Brevundimonas sp.]
MLISNTTSSQFTGRDISPQAGRLSTRLLVALGALDVSVIIALALSISASTWYMGVLAAKLIILLFNSRHIEINRRTLVFLGAVIFGVLPGTLLNSYVGDGITRIFGFCAQIFLTVSLLGRNGLPLYLRSAAFAISIAAAIHTAMCLGGLIPDHYGRFFYFGGSHFNLGAEIGAIGVFAAALSMNWRQLIPVAAAIASSVWLLQGRSALLAIALIMFIRFAQFVISHSRRTPLLTLGVAGACSTVAAALLAASGQIAGGLSQLFMLTDQHRGIGTGFVGRSERWAHAYELFTQQYVFGVGASYFESRGEFGPHNYFLYGLTTMGILGFSVFASVIMFMIYAIFRSDKKSALILLGIFPLLMFNDRMININPYPFILYVTLLVFPISKTPWMSSPPKLHRISSNR